MANLLDRGFRFHRALGQLLAEMTLKLSNAAVLPFDVERYAAFLEQDLALLEARYRDILAANGASFGTHNTINFKLTSGVHESLTQIK